MLNTRLTAVPMEHMEVSLTGDKTTRHLRTITAKVKVMLASLEEARKSAASKADASMYGGADSGSGGSADELDDGGSLDARQVTFAAAEHPPTAETHSNNSNNNTGEARPGRSSKSSATRGATRPGASTKRWGTQRRGHQPTGASSASKVSRVRVCVCVCARARPFVHRGRKPPSPCMPHRNRASATARKAAKSPLSRWHSRTTSALGHSPSPRARCRLLHSVRR